MNTLEELTEIVWLPASLAQKVKHITDGKLLEAEILKYAEQSKDSLRIDIESIGEDIVQYRAHMIKAKNAFREAKEEQLQASYEMWEKFEDDMKVLKGHVERAKSELQPLKDELNELKSLMNQVDKFGIGDLLSLIKSINSNYYGETAAMIKFLFENYKKA
jgi:chromosome segregation ATPase